MIRKSIFIVAVLFVLVLYPASGVFHSSSYSLAQIGGRSSNMSEASLAGISETGMQQVAQSLSAPSIQSQIDLASAKAQQLHLELDTAKMSKYLMSAYNLLSNQISFVSAIGTHGGAGFSWGIGDNFNNNFGPTAGFLVSWATGSIENTLSWTMFLNNGTLVGPVSTSSVAHVECNNSCNWAGNDFYQCCYSSLLSTNAIVNTPTIENPPSGQKNGNGMHIVASIWVGMSPSSGGGGGLIQTGYSYDVTQGGHYQFWYENYPSIFSTDYTSGQCGNGRTYANPGDSVQESVEQSGNNNEFSIYDSTSNVLCQASYNHAETPVYAEAIVEAFAYCFSGHQDIQQIAELSTTVTFSSGYLVIYTGQPGGELESWNYLHGNGWYHTFTLQQSSATIQNIQDGYSTSAGGPQMTWQNSDYN